jgi:hypothetical protein
VLDKLSSSQNRFFVAGVVIIILALCLSAYAATVPAKPLLDEIYMLDLMKARSSNSVMNFLTSMLDWPGPLPEDTWGFVATSILALLANLSNSNLIFLRSVSIATHALNAIIFFFVARASLAPVSEERPAVSSYLAAAAAMLFSVYPLAPEAVSWLGGMAYEIGSLFWLLAFYLYLKGKSERDWTILGVAWISFLFAVLSDNSLWSSGFIIVALELSKSFIGPVVLNKDARVPSEEEVFEDAVDRMLEDAHKGHHHVDSQLSGSGGSESPDVSRHGTAPGDDPKTPRQAEQDTDEKAGEPRVYDMGDSPDDLFDTLTPALPFIVLGVLISIRALPAYGNEQLPGDMIAGFGDWGRVLKNLFLPVNQSITPSHAQAYLQLYIFYGALSVVSLIALVKSKQFRQNSAFLFAWLIMIVVPHLHTAVSDTALVGSRLAYSAVIPTTGLIALLLFSPLYAFQNQTNNNPDSLKKLTMVAAITLLVILLPMKFLKTVQQNIAYHESADKLNDVMNQANQIGKRNNSKLALIRDIPGDVAMGEQISPYRMVMLDTEKRLIRASQIPGGRLKEAFKSGHYLNVAVRWNSAENKLQPIDLSQKVLSNLKFDIAEIQRRLKPGMENFEATKSEQVNGELVLQGDQNQRAIVNIDATGLSPLGDDFIYIDCKIKTVDDEPDQEVALYWLTEEIPTPDEDRKSVSKITVNDEQFYRYYFPVRSTAWTTNGSITNLSFVFPAQSRVSIKEIGTLSTEDRLPMLSFANVTDTAESAAVESTKEPIFAALTYDYPNMPDLGLVNFERKTESINFNYDASEIPSAHACLVEISRVNRFFEQPNADRKSKSSIKSITLENTRGQFKLTDKDLKVDGIYSIRMFAVDKEGKLLSNSSDAINCLIYTRPRRI